ncbi:MAG: hypothetical protein DCC58_03790 [Chloroflexi bacterium]|nr:MAG: hypothetical protein DCC58_03790 [Chloroflexota bacterium]
MLIVTTGFASMSGNPPFAAAAPGEIDNAFFQHTWDRTDALVAGGAVARTWVWGAALSTGAGETYDDSPGGVRLVQYFEKSRMEISNPDDDPSDIWYVTNGLLARELITGQLQVGDNRHIALTPARVNIAGDPDDPDGPTYASFLPHLAAAPPAEGSPLTTTISRDATLGCCVPDSYGTTAGPLVDATNHRVASVFWDYLHTEGAIIERERRTRGTLFPNPFYATGYPIGEAYWALVRVAGVQQWVLVQPFERRVLTYTPGNAAGWQVEMGNVGAHYFYWRYGDGAETAPPPDWTLPAYPTYPLPAGQQVEIPDLDLHYTLDLAADVATGAVDAWERIHIAAAPDGLPDTLYLQVVPAQYGYFTVNSISVAGEPGTVSSAYGGFILQVHLPQGLAPPVDIDISFRLDVGTYPNDFIGTVRDQGVLRLGYWFPIVSDLHGYSETFDPSQSRIADFDVTLDVADDVIVAHTGEVVSRASLGDGRTRHRLTASAVRDFALVLSPSFAITQAIEPITGTQVLVYSLPGATPGQIDTMLTIGMESIRRLSELVGPYIYPTYSIVDVGPNMPGGLEFPQLIYVNVGYVPLDRLIYHETAHQWCYAIIGNRTLIDGWIDEGCAEFFERGLPSGFSEVPDPPAGGYLYWLDSTYEELPLDASRQWYYSVYEQGARFYYDLRAAMGIDPFWAAWRAIYHLYALGVMTPWEMLATFQEHSPTDLRPIFDDYFRYPWIWELLPEGG